jgi:hypothetical protein
MRDDQVYIIAQPTIESGSDEVGPWHIVLRTLSQPLPKVQFWIELLKYRGMSGVRRSL